MKKLYSGIPTLGEQLHHNISLPSQLIPVETDHENRSASHLQINCNLNICFYVS